MQSVLIIVHAPAYGSERMLSALRLATAIAAQELETVDLRLFMMSDAVTVGLNGQAAVEAGGGLQQMLEELLRYGARIHLCRSCALLGDGRTAGKGVARRACAARNSGRIASG